ncbi:hypothetical protein QMK33_04405 [Hymenobacter sp. H14-R3]|uniref:hypothetical protein n=1 Tax=Hymenobacter sp. H14-R3 TaxID=3046308 RepID=UPI0024B94709|nr:hypothetical protein [Hymenobacter sp. H14-R3]MDJ0364382.1 hypothetical protein [Hymenobacter sp. H14-R3]
MRLVHLFSLLLGLVLGGSFGQPYRAAAQTAADSARLSYGEEVLNGPDTTALRLQTLERGQWKLGLNNFTLGQASATDFYTRYGVHLAYERKLGPAWAVQGEVSPAVVRYRGPDGQLQRAASARVQLMGRYYYDLERRRRRGKDAGSFSGNYFAVALGAGLGRHTRDTPFYYYFPSNALSNKGLADFAMLYGLQRRLGRLGFIDANLGLTQLIAPKFSDFQLNASLRVGLLLGAAPPLARLPLRLSAAEDATLRPRYYVGVQGGSYNYQVRFDNFDPYAARPGGFPSFFQRAGVGSYGVEVKNPYVYVGYQLRPRLAVQLGYQGQAGTGRSESYVLVGAQQILLNASENYQQTLTFPLLLRYAITRQYLQRVQFEVVGGVALSYARVRFSETKYDNGQVKDQFAFARQTTSGHAIGGLNVGYGFGRRRKLQATAEYVFIQNLQTSFSGFEVLQAGGSLGLRYRFAYR